MADEYVKKEDVLKEKRTGTFPNGICMEAKACVTVEYIKSLEPADVAPVVRCKDCKLCDCNTWWCDRGYIATKVKPDDFCSYGERKE